MLNDDIVRLTPYLRRYARALTGDQPTGDGLVRQALEAVVNGEAPQPDGAAVNLVLLRAFHRVWRRRLAGGPPELAHASKVDVRLGLLAPERRAALLLVAMEGLSPKDAASTLDVEEDEVEARLQAAALDIERQLATDVLIIEDEPIVALDLERLVSDLGHRVVGVTATREEAWAVAHRHELGLVLADVRLADGSTGLEAAGDILRRFDIPVIFITAFPEQLLTGEGREPTFLVTKPFREDAVKALIGQALFFHQPASTTSPEQPAS